jgi:hypothetical protein
MELFVTLNVATFKNIQCTYPNSLQIFHFCCIHENEREKSKPCCRTLFELYLEMLEVMKKIIANLITIVQNYDTSG